MQTISIKIEQNLVNQMQRMMKSHYYATKTEFIREAIRDKITNLREKEVANTN